MLWLESGVTRILPCGKTQVWEERRVDMHESNVWLNLSSSPEASMSHMARALEPTLMPSEPRHSQPRALLAGQSGSAGSDGCSTLTFPGRLALQTSCVNAVGSSPCRLPADFEWLVTLGDLMKEFQCHSWGFAVIAGTFAVEKAHRLASLSRVGCSPPFFLPLSSVVLVGVYQTPEHLFAFLLVVSAESQWPKREPG